MDFSKRSEISYQDLIARLYPEREHADGELSTKTVTFQVTDACNLACTYCYQINKHHNKMPFEVAQKFIEMLLEKDNKDTNRYLSSWDSTAVIIEFIGGEPFLEIDLIDQISDYFVKRLIELNHPWQYHYMFSICSNGVLYFDPKVQKYIKKHQGHLSFSISIDGNKKLHDSCRVFPDGRGSYDIAIAGVKHYVETYHQEMGSKMTIAPGNIQYLAEAVESLVENGYTTIHLNCVYEEGWNDELAIVLYEQLKVLADYLIDNDLVDKVYCSMFEGQFFKPKSIDDTKTWCGGNCQMISIDWRGDIYPCIRYMESSLGSDQKPLIMGNVYDGLLTKKEWCDDFECLSCTTRLSESTQECIDCPIADGCSECLAYNYQLYGLPIKRAIFICPMHKARSLANAYYWNKYFKKQGTNERFKIWLPDEECLKYVSQEELDYLHSLEK